MINVCMAHSLNYAFGTKNGGLPWPPSKKDMEFFVEISNKADYILVSPTTWESLPSKAKTRLSPKVIVVRYTNPEILKTFQESENMYLCIGGRQLIEEVLPYADKLYLSIFQFNVVQDGTVTFLRDSTVEKINALFYKQQTLETYGSLSINIFRKII